MMAPVYMVEDAIQEAQGLLLQGGSLSQEGAARLELLLQLLPTNGREFLRLVYGGAR